MLLHLEGERERVGGGPSCVASCMLMIFISDLSFVIKGLVLCRERERPGFDERYSLPHALDPAC